MRTKKSPKRANIAKINFVAVRPLIALASDKVEREDVLWSQTFKTRTF